MLAVDIHNSTPIRKSIASLLTNRIASNAVMPTTRSAILQNDITLSHIYALQLEKLSVWLTLEKTNAHTLALIAETLPHIALYNITHRSYGAREHLLT